MVKKIIRKVLNTLHLDLTKNLEYDRLTTKILNKVIKPGSVCVDVGCHKGEILEIICNKAPGVKHFAFEPVPYYFHYLVDKFNGKCNIYQYALSDQDGVSEFHFVKNAPAFSGIKKRKYDVASPEIEKIQVQLKRLDQVIPENVKIDLIKIDVEGAEYQVLSGAEKILKKDKPVLIFECGLGASDYYNTKPADVFSYLEKFNYNISLLKNYLDDKPSLTKKDFMNVYEKNQEYYFIAY